MYNHISLDKVYKPANELLVLDYRVAVYELLKSWQPSKEYQQWQQYLNSLFLSSHSVIVVDDKRDDHFAYWRNHWITNNSHLGLPQYKANRNQLSYDDKPPGYLELYNTGLQYIANNGIDYFSKELYEADDWMGAIYRLKANHSELPGIIICSVDKDLYQLVNNRLNIKFYCLGRYKQASYLKDELEILTEFMTSDYPLSHPSQIVEYKVIYGDAGDNIIPGTPRALIDLREPPVWGDFTDTEYANLLAAIKSPNFKQTKLKAIEAAIDLCSASW